MWTISGFDPNDMALFLSLIEGAAAHVGRRRAVPEQAAELIDWAESSTGPGLEAIQQALDGFSRGALPGRPADLVSAISFLTPFLRYADFVGRSDDLDRLHAVLFLTGHRNAVSSVAMSPDGRRIVSGSRDRTVAVWDLESGQRLASLTLDGPIPSVTWHPDGRSILAGDGKRNRYRLEYRDR